MIHDQFSMLNDPVAGHSINNLALAIRFGLINFCFLKRKI